MEIVRGKTGFFGSLFILDFLQSALLMLHILGNFMLDFLKKYQCFVANQINRTMHLDCIIVKFQIKNWILHRDFMKMGFQPYLQFILIIKLQYDSF